MAESKKRQACFGDHRRRDGERRLDDQRRDDVWQHMAQRNPPRRVADRPRREDEIFRFDRERLPAGEPHEYGRRGNPDRDHRVGKARSEERRERDREDEKRTRQHGVGQPRNQHVDLAAGVAGEQSNRDADRQRNDHRDDAGEQRRTRAEYHPRRHVAADFVGAEPVFEARRLANRAPACRKWIVWRHERRK